MTAVEDRPYRPCVGLAIINREGLLFAGQRIDNPGKAWQMPQGGIDEGESPLEAAMRELGEETGLAPHHVEVLGESADWVPYELPPELLSTLWGGRFRGQRQKWFALRFTGVDSDIDITGHEPEFSTWDWLHPDAVIEHIVPFKRGIYEAVLAEFAPFLAR